MARLEQMISKASISIEGKDGWIPVSGGENYNPKMIEMEAASIAVSMNLGSWPWRLRNYYRLYRLTGATRLAALRLAFKASIQ
jgi:hypothetical protein